MNDITNNIIEEKCEKRQSTSSLALPLRRLHTHTRTHIKDKSARRVSSGGMGSDTWHSATQMRKQKTQREKNRWRKAEKQRASNNDKRKESAAT